MTVIEELDRGHKAYGQDFQFYNENQWCLTHYANRISQVIRDKKIRSLLSLGIGFQTVSDRIIQELEHHLERYEIVEGSGVIIEKFKAQFDPPSQVNLVHSLFESYETADQFEAIEVGFVLEHVDNPQSLLQQFAQYLSPGGSIFVSVPNARSLHRLIGHEAGLLDDIYQLSDADIQLGHKRYFDLDSLQEMVLNAGLTVMRVQGLMLKPITGAQISALGWDNKIVQALLNVGDDYPEIANNILIEATK
jgi:SAM-dependent methyltransferase